MSNMSAKEMFEELGYEYIECYFKQTLDDIYYQKEGKYTPQIQFSLNHKIIKVSGVVKQEIHILMVIYKKKILLHQ